MESRGRKLWSFLFFIVFKGVMLLHTQVIISVNFKLIRDLKPNKVAKIEWQIYIYCTKVESLNVINFK